MGCCGRQTHTQGVDLLVISHDADHWPPVGTSPFSASRDETCQTDQPRWKYWPGSTTLLLDAETLRFQIRPLRPLPSPCGAACLLRSLLAVLLSARETSCRNWKLISYLHSSELQDDNCVVDKFWSSPVLWSDPCKIYNSQITQRPACT